MNRNNPLLVLRKIWGVFTTILVVLLAVGVYLVTSALVISVDPSTTYYLQLFAIMLVLLGVLFTRFYSRSKLSKLDGSLQVKMHDYKKIQIIVMAVNEAAGTLSIIFYMLTGSQNLLLIALICILLLLTNYPSISRVANEVGATQEEIKEIV